MKLHSADVANLSTVLNLCQIGGVDAIIFEDGKVRGMNDERSFVIISDLDIPKLPAKMGVTRLNSLKQRLDMFNGTRPDIDAQENDRGEIAVLNISAGKSKVQFRCTSTSLIKAPKVINDTEMYNITISKEELKVILNAVKVMNSKTLQVTIRKSGEVSVGLSDDANDIFNIDLEHKAETLETESAVYYYFAEIFSSVMRHNLNNDLTSAAIGEMGTIRTQLHGHQVILMPKINDEGDD